MKIRSLLLGSAAAAGLATGAYAADPVTMTALDICDALGKTGITVSSDTNCLQLSGEVTYEFNWGDYEGGPAVVTSGGGYGAFTIIDNGADPAGRDNDWKSDFNAYLKAVATADSSFGPASATIKIKQRVQRVIVNEANAGVNGRNDVTFLTGTTGANLLLGDGDDVLVSPGPDGVTGTADDIILTRAAAPGITGALGTPAVGGAAGTPTFIVAVANGPDGLPNTADDIITQAGPNGVAGGGDDTVRTRGAAIDDPALIGGDDTGGVIFDEAFISVGDSTVIMMGKKGTIMNTDDDAPFNWLGLFNSEKVDAGVKWTKDLIPDGGTVVQIVSDLGNGITAGAGLEKLDTGGLATTSAKAGTAVGVLTYAGEGITAHVTVVAAGVLDGVVENYAVHAGFTGTFDAFKLRGAIAADNTGYWNGLASAQATFDMFTLAASVEANQDAAGTDFGVGGSLGVTVADGVSINLGGRYYQDASGPDGFQVAAQLVAAVTDTLTLTAEIGDYGNNAGLNAFYGKGIAAWAPGGDLTMSAALEANSLGGYKTTIKGGKKF